MTIGDLIEKYVAEFAQPGSRVLGSSQLCILRLVQRAPIAAKEHTSLKPLDFMEHCKARRSGVFQSKRGGAVKPQTVNQDIVFLGVVLKHAVEVWELPDAGLLAYKKAKPQLVKQQLIGKAQARDRRPSEEELERLLAYFAEYATRDRAKIPMQAIVEFSVWSARRISETCRLQWGDVDMEKRTCLVRDLKNSKGKGFHATFPLLGRAWEIVMAQPRRSDDPNERIFPYVSKSVSAAYTAAKKVLGIKGLRLHDNRREAISRLFEQGYNVPEVSLVSLHRNPTQLLGTYTRLKPEGLHAGPASKRTSS